MAGTPHHQHHAGAATCVLRTPHLPCHATCVRRPAQGLAAVLPQLVVVGCRSQGAAAGAQPQQGGSIQQREHLEGVQAGTGSKTRGSGSQEAWSGKARVAKHLARGKG